MTTGMIRASPALFILNSVYHFLCACTGTPAWYALLIWAVSTWAYFAADCIVRPVVTLGVIYFVTGIDAAWTAAALSVYLMITAGEE